MQETVSLFMFLLPLEDKNVEMRQDRVCSQQKTKYAYTMIFVAPSLVDLVNRQFG